MSCHFLGEDPLYRLTGNSPKARHGASVIADQKMRRGKIGKNGNHISLLNIQMYWEQIVIYRNAYEDN